MDDFLPLESFSSLGFWHSPLSWFSFYFTGFLFSFFLLAALLFLHLCTLPYLPFLGYFIQYPDLTLLAHLSQVCVTRLHFPHEIQIILSNTVLRSFIWISNWYFILTMSKIELWISNSHLTQTWCLHRLAYLSNWHHCASSCWGTGFRGILHLPICSWLAFFINEVSTQMLLPQWRLSRSHYLSQSIENQFAQTSLPN